MPWKKLLLVMAMISGCPAFVDIANGAHACPAGQFEVVAGTANPDRTLNIHELNGFAIVVP